MSKEKFNVSLIITIGTILLTVGGSWAVVQNKVKDIDKLKEQTEIMDKRLVKVETMIENIDDNLTEQRADIKLILKELKK
jgi:hypothetical protein